MQDFGVLGSGSVVPAAFACCSTDGLSGVGLSPLTRRQSSGLMTLTPSIDIRLGVGGGAGVHAHSGLHARRGEVN